MRHIKSYKLFENDNNRKKLSAILSDKFIANGFDKPDDLNKNYEFMASVNGKNIGELRISTYNGWVSMEMIEVYPEFQRKGYGYILYKILLDSAIEAGYEGLRSPAFDENFTGQQRSPGASAVLQKLINAEGGKIVDVENQVDPLDIEDLKTDGAPFYGPPYLDFYVDGSGQVKKEKK